MTVTVTDAPKIKTRRPRDMAISLIVLLVPVFLGVMAYRYLYQGDTIATVDPTETIASAQRGGLTQLPPATAPDGWKIVRAEFAEGTLRIGYLTKDEHGVLLIQKKGEIADTAHEGEVRLTGPRSDGALALIGKSADLNVLIGHLGPAWAPA